MFRTLRNRFISGLLVLAPVGVTILVVDFLVQKLGAPTRRIILPGLGIDEDSRFWLDYGLNIASLVIVLVLITLLGWLSQLFIGRFVVKTFERIVDGLPVVRSVYNTVKQIRDTFVQQDKAVFQKTVLVEYPRTGVWVLGFLTGSGKGEPQSITQENLLNIFVPTTPNPTSGFLLMVPEDEVKFMQMSVSDGMKLIISGGAVVPPFANFDGTEPVKIPKEPDSDD